MHVVEVRYSMQAVWTLQQLAAQRLLQVFGKQIFSDLEFG